LCCKLFHSAVSTVGVM